MHSRLLPLVLLTALLWGNSSNVTAASWCLGVGQARADEVSSLPTAGSRKIVVHGTPFESNTATIAPEATALLDEAVQLLMETDGGIAIVPDTATMDDDPYLLLLTHRRARAVRRYLIDHGIAAARIAVPGSGAPSAELSGASGHATFHDLPVELQLD